MFSMLKLRQTIPPLTMRALHATPQVVGAPLAEGRMVRAWDYKQKRALVIAFLHHDCETCRAWVESLRRVAAALAEQDAVALLVFPTAPDARLLENAPANIVMGVDVNGRSITAFLGKPSFDGVEQDVGVFVTDRYGELCAQWPEDMGDANKESLSAGRSKDRPLHHLPATEEILSCLTHIQSIC